MRYFKKTSIILIFIGSAVLAAFLFSDSSIGISRFRKDSHRISLNDFARRYPHVLICSYYVVFDATVFNIKDNKTQRHSFHSLSFLDRNQPPGWCVLVTNLENLTTLSTCNNCMILQKSWVDSNVVEVIKQFQTKKYGLSGSIVNKMAAYLYVLQQPTEWIYVTDRLSPVPYHYLMRLIQKELKTGLVYEGGDPVFQPCSHFVDSGTWRKHGGVANQNRFNVKIVSTHSVYYVIDSCFKSELNQTQQQKVVDDRAPIPYIMAGTYGPIDFRNVLVSNTNAWSLIAGLFPETNQPLTTAVKNTDDSGSKQKTHERTLSQNVPDDILINILIQRMLWETEGTIGFIPAISNHSSITGCKACDIQTRIGATNSKFRNDLLSWRCDSFQPVIKCLEILISELKPVSDTVRFLVKVWIYLFDKYKLKVNLRTPFSEDKLLEKKRGIPFHFSPASLFNSSKSYQDTNPFSELCSLRDQPYASIIPHEHPITDILLIIVFNFPFLVTNIPILNYVYGRHFKHVIYCAESINDFNTLYQRNFPNEPVTFLEIKHYKGYWGQNCMAASIKLGYDVTGYLQIGDDVILNVWNLKHLPYQQPWFQSNMRVAHVDRNIVPDVWSNTYWWPWTQFSGKQSAVKAMNQLQSMMGDPVKGDRISEFMENLYNITQCRRCFLYEASDIVYVPVKLGDKFTFFSDIFSMNQVFLEITFPTVLSGITSDRNVYRLRGNYLWFHERERHPYVYTEFDHFYHAWKLPMLADKQNAYFFCHTFLSRIDFDLMKRPYSKS